MNFNGRGWIRTHGLWGSSSLRLAAEAKADGQTATSAGGHRSSRSRLARTAASACVIGLALAVLALPAQRAEAQQLKFDLKLGGKEKPNSDPARSNNSSKNSKGKGDFCDSQEKASVASDNGPDVLGWRIGMTPAEACAIFNTRHIKVGGRHGNLSGSVSNPVEYVMLLGLDSHSRKDATGIMALETLYTPTPGNERLFYVSRYQTTKDEKPTSEALAQSLKEKYGAPTAWKGNYFTWIWDKNGALRKQGAATVETFTRCNNLGFSWYSKIVDTASGSRQEAKKPLLGNLKALAEQCGAISLRVEFTTENGPGHLVQDYKVTMASVGMLADTLGTAIAISEKARADEGKAATAKGNKAKKQDL